MACPSSKIPEFTHVHKFSDVRRQKTEGKGWKTTNNQENLKPVCFWQIASSFFWLFLVPPTFLDWQIHSFRLEKLLFFRFFRSGKYQERIEEEFKEEQELKPLIKRFLSFVIISERLLWPNLWLSNSFLCSLLMFSQCSLWPVVLYCCLLIFPLAFDSFYWDITCTIAQPLEG